MPSIIRSLLQRLTFSVSLKGLDCSEIMPQRGAHSPYLCNLCRGVMWGGIFKVKALFSAMPENSYNVVLLEGNKFYEYPPAQPGSTRTKRRVKYARLGDAYSYATGLSRLPGAHFEKPCIPSMSVDDSTLSPMGGLVVTHQVAATNNRGSLVSFPLIACMYFNRLITRHQQELITDLARQQRVTALAAQIQARDDEERARQIAATKPDPGMIPLQETHLGVPQQAALPHDSAPQDLRAEAQRRARLEEPQDARIPSQPHEELQAWSPGSIRQRSRDP